MQIKKWWHKLLGAPLTQRCDFCDNAARYVVQGREKAHTCAECYDFAHTWVNL